MRKVWRKVAPCLVLVMSLSCAAAAGSEPPTGALAPPSERELAHRQRFDEQRAQALQLAHSGDHRRARRALARVMRDPIFETLAAAQRREILAAAGKSAVMLDDAQSGRDLYRRAIDADPGYADDWYRLMACEYVLGHLDASAQALIHFTESWPQYLDNLDEVLIFQLVHRLPHASPVRLQVLQALLDANWNRRGMGVSNLWYELALMRVERGETELARKAVARIGRPYELVKLRSDKRFDALINSHRWKFDVEAAAKREVDNLQVRAALQADKLDAQRELLDAMLVAGMNEEALTFADSLLARAGSAQSGKPPFVDPDQQPWVMNNRSIALRRLGRNEEALDELVRASHFGEAGSGGVNVSQALNLGLFYCALGRPDDALAAIATLGEMSDYGRLAQALVQEHAYLQKGDARRADHALAYLRAHAKESPSMLVDALILADRSDEAAQQLIAMLASPDDRVDALAWLQQYRTSTALPADAPAQARREAVRQRADVLQAVDKVGRVARYDIYGPYED